MGDLFILVKDRKFFAFGKKFPKDVSETERLYSFRKLQNSVPTKFTIKQLNNCFSYIKALLHGTQFYLRDVNL